MAFLGFLSILIVIFLVLRGVKQYYKEKLSIQYTDYDTDEKPNMVRLAIYIVLLILGFIFINYFIMVRINLRYIGIYFYLIVFLTILYTIIDQLLGWNNEKRIKVTILTFSSFVLFLVVFFVFGGRTYFHSEAYSNLITIEEEDFISDVTTVDITNLPIVDKAYGEKQGSIKLGEYPGIGSEFEAGEYSDIIYQGQQYLVAPLEYRGIFKWLNNNDLGTPGYIMINKVTTEATLVNIRESNGEGLIYTPSAYFSQDLYRHAYYNGLARYSHQSTYFEIDENGVPYYVMSYALPTIFVNGGEDIAKIAVVNAINGNVEIYDPQNVPNWVESVYPENLVFNQLDYWGSLQDGWINSVFQQKGVLQSSNGTRVIMNDGELFYFTGLTSAGNDESTIGFVYTSTRTKEARLFKFPGATEQAAMNKAMTLIPQNNISTSFPIPVNVQDTPTYFILIKGEDGRIIRNVFIKVQDLEFNTIEVKLQDAYDSYLLGLGSDASSVMDVSGTVTDITSYVQDGNTIYWIEVNSVYYMVDVSGFTDEELRDFVKIAIGDNITVKVLDYRVITIE